MSDESRFVWWLSFCDPDRPAGTQFIGVALVAPAVDDFVVAVMEATRAGCNPGGEVQGRPHAPMKYWPKESLGKLLTKEEAFAAEAAAKAKYEAELNSGDANVAG